VSASLKADTYNHFKVSRDIEVIPNFVCIEGCDRPEVDEELKHNIAPNGEKILAHVSNFRKVKRVGDVVEIFARVRKEIPCKLLLIGDGPDRNEAEVFCRERGISEDLRVLGKVKDTERVLGIADLFLLPSESESFGLAALEAMSCGVPVISSNTGGIPEVNEHGFSGYLSNVGDVDDMATNALSMLKNEEKLKQMKLQAFGQAKKFDILNVLPMYEKLYKKVLSKE
jgi:N-acetyl-alpha-D-glucosaminyl L-malate synthase BshA